MKNRIIRISINDIIVAPEKQSTMITAACNREIPMAPTGICQVGDNILVALEECEPVPEIEYILSPFQSINIDDIATEISTRFFSGFSLIGGFDVKLDKWALFKLNKNF